MRASTSTVKLSVVNPSGMFRRTGPRLHRLAAAPAHGSPRPVSRQRRTVPARLNASRESPAANLRHTDPALVASTPGVEPFRTAKLGPI